MTREMAIANLKKAKCIPYKKETLAMAIKSLEAWDEVITGMSRELAKVTSLGTVETDKRYGLDYSLDLIDKVLSGKEIGQEKKQSNGLTQSKINTFMVLTRALITSEEKR